MKLDTDYEIEYGDDSGYQTIRTISPIRFFSYNSSEYIEAYCHLRKENRTFKIDRVKSFKPVGEKSISSTPEFPEETWGKTSKKESDSKILVDDKILESDKKFQEKKQSYSISYKDKPYWNLERILKWSFWILVAYFIFY
tara:strand:- start:32 stop:451 length:420 start_codon:yes stop_codon:yes gene_type:complete